MTRGAKDGTLGSMDRGEVRVSAQVLASIVRTARANDVDPAPVLARLGLTDADLADADRRLPLTLEDQLFEGLAEVSGDPCFGLHAAGHLETDRWDVFGYALTSSPTLRDAILAAGRFNRLLHDVAELGLAEVGDEAVIMHHFRGLPRGPGWQATDFTLASLMRVASLLTGTEVRARRVALAHGEPADAKPYRDVFGVTPEFGVARSELVLDREALDRPTRGGDPNLHAVLRRHAEDLLARLPVADDLVSKVRAILADALRGGDPSKEAIAKQLAMSPRTLSRRLAEHEQTFQGLLDALRGELATAYLGEGMSNAEVAYLLGFSEPRAFLRAFKRWTGHTPQAWREVSSPAGGPTR